jgi:hypothetical protein
MSTAMRVALGVTAFALLAAGYLALRAPERGDEEGDTVARAEAYCARQNVAAVYVSGDMVKVVGSLLGAGATYYGADGSELHCPIVAPEAISVACREVQAVQFWVEICANPPSR